MAEIRPKSGLSSAAFASSSWPGLGDVRDHFERTRARVGASRNSYPPDTDDNKAGRVVATGHRSMAGLRQAHQPLGGRSMEGSSDTTVGPGDSYCLVAMGRALGTTESHGAMGIVCGGRRMERRMVAPRCPQPTLHRSGPSQIQVAQRTPDAGDAGGRRLLLRGMWGGAVANGHGEWFTVECVECSGRKEHRGRNACM